MSTSKNTTNNSGDSVAIVLDVEQARTLLDLLHATMRAARTEIDEPGWAATMRRTWVAVAEAVALVVTEDDRGELTAFAAARGLRGEEALSLDAHTRGTIGKPVARCSEEDLADLNRYRETLVLRDLEADLRAGD